MISKGLKTSLYSLFIAATLLSSCKKDSALSDLPDANSPQYDQALKDAILSATNGEGNAALILPESTDFASIPQDPENPITAAKVELGRLLFHETGIGQDAKYSEGMQSYSCASCHHAAAGFQANLPQGIGDGGVGFGISGEGRLPSGDYSLDSIDVQPIRTPSAMNGAYQEVMLWNGQFGATGPNEGTEDQWPMGSPIFNNQFGHQGLETQAIAGLTVHRMVVEETLCNDYIEYDELFDAAFPDWPEATRVSVRTGGLAIGAYERTIMANQSPWQDYLRGNENALSNQEKRGASLFFGKAECSNCHNGPALNSMTFHAIGMKDLAGAGTYGDQVSDAVRKGRGGFTGNSEDDYKFKTPQLYNLMDSPFFGHGSSFTSVRDVVEYKNNAQPENYLVPESQLAEDFHGLNLTDDEIDAIVAFIENALYDAGLARYAPVDLPTGYCFPNNDVQSQIDQGCAQ